MNFSRRNTGASEDSNESQSDQELNHAIDNQTETEDSTPLPPPSKKPLKQWVIQGMVGVVACGLVLIVANFVMSEFNHSTASSTNTRSARVPVSVSVPVALIEPKEATTEEGASSTIPVESELPLVGTSQVRMPLENRVKNLDRPTTPSAPDPINSEVVKQFEIIQARLVGVENDVQTLSSKMNERLNVLDQTYQNHAKTKTTNSNSHGSEGQKRNLQKKSKNNKEDVVHLNEQDLSDFSLQAMVVGQAWIAYGMSNTLIVHVGDTLPGGALITKIDVENGKVMTNQGVLNSN